MKRKTEIFNEKMENFSEIRFTNTVWELNVNVVAKADGEGGVELFRKNFFGELLPYGGRIDKREFLEGFKKLSVGNWKKTYKGKGKIVNGQEWQLEIVFGDGSLQHFSGENECPPDYFELSRLFRTSLAV